MVEGKGKGSATYEQAALSLLDLYKPKKKICDTPSFTNVEIGVDTDKMNMEGDTEIQNSGEQQGEDVFKKVDLEENTAKLDEGQARTDPVKAALDKNFSSIWTYTTMMLLRVRHHHGEDVYIQDLVDFYVTMSTSRGK
nr:hypothetical protein [Tanacetum cinerariifolium]